MTFPFFSPSSSSLQRQYVDKRHRALFANDDAKTAAVERVILGLQKRFGVGEPWINTYTRLCHALQAAPLTINIEANKWFLTENRHKTYDQMYRRGVGADGRMTLADADKKNPVAVRAIVDDLVTLPDEWALAAPHSQRRRLYEAMNATGATQQSKVLKAKAADHPNLVPTAARADGTAQFQSTNAAFKPKTKQTFAALNYGHRETGACVFYGHSHLVLRPEMKQRAIFYPGDTFGIARLGIKAQATYYTLGALVEHADPKLLDAIWAACYQRRTLDETAKANLLVEAHLFCRLDVAKDVEKLVLCRRRDDREPQLDANEWQTILMNAKAWCAKFGVQMDFAA